MASLARWALLASWLLVLSLNVIHTATCRHDCGDMGGRFYFLLLVSTTPAALWGLLVHRKRSSGGCAASLVASPYLVLGALAVLLSNSPLAGLWFIGLAGCIIAAR